MAFYLSQNGKARPFFFDYIKEAGVKRIEKTLVKGKKKKKAPFIPDKIHFVTEIMSRKIIFLTPHASLKEAQKIFKTKKIHHLVILMDGVLKGLLSDRDFIKHSLKKNTADIPISKVMAKLVLSASDSTSIEDIALVMIKEDISALPIVGDELELLGIVTRSDVLKWVVNKSYLK